MHKLVRSVLRFATCAPRLFAAFWSSGFAVGTALVLIGWTTNAPLLTLWLYVALPAFLAGLVGYSRGAAILDPRMTKGYMQAVLMGTRLALLSFLIFTPLVVIVYSLTALPTFPPFSQLLAMLAAFAFGGLLFGGPAILFAAAVAGVTLHAVGRCALRMDQRLPRVPVP